MKFVPKAVTQSISTSVLNTKKNSPHIFFGVGLGGIILSTVLACRATLKVEDIVDEAQYDINEVKKLHETESRVENEYRKDLGYVYVKSAANVAKLYGPSVVIGGLSVAALTGSHVQMTRRNAALTATLTLVSKAYDDYRKRVRDELGVEGERELYHSVSNTIIAEREDGTKDVVKVADPNSWSPYARFFDESCSAWEKSSELNRLTVQMTQNYYNARLQTRGHVFLNEVYDAFGIERSSAGSVVGWVLDSDGPGDNYIDFGMFEAYNRDFVNGQERSILLDFNVDGVIYDKI